MSSKNNLTSELLENFVSGITETNLLPTSTEEEKTQLELKLIKDTHVLEQNLKKIHIREAKFNIPLRICALLAVMGLFGWLNLRVIDFIEIAYSFDVKSIEAELYTSKERVINSKVYIALIGGIMAQTAAAFIVVVHYLFPRNK